MLVSNFLNVKVRKTFFSGLYLCWFLVSVTITSEVARKLGFSFARFSLVTVHGYKTRLAWREASASAQGEG